MRATFEAGRRDILPEIISKEPLGPVVRHGDPQWADFVRWTLNALIAAEELGITSANVKSSSAGTRIRKSTVSSEPRATWGRCSASRDWANAQIKAGGNYGELFAKKIGENTPVGLARGLNAQWTNGGLMYSPPFR